MHCSPGKVVVGGMHCCWPAQEWSNASQECVGVPVCANGFVLTEDFSCVADEGPNDVSNTESASDSSSSETAAIVDLPPMRVFPSASGDEMSGPFRFEIGADFGYMRARSLDVPLAGYTLALHLRDVPLLFRVELDGTAYGLDFAYPDGSRGNQATLVGGLAFAPFSLSPLGSGKFSFFNPFVGADFAYLFWWSASSDASAPVKDGGAIYGVIGNSFFPGSNSSPTVGFTVLAERAFVDVDSRANVRITGKAAIVIF